VHLGGLSGFDLRDRLVAAGVAPPIIFITAHDIPPARLVARGRVSGYLRKPFCTEALLALVRRHLHDAPSNGTGL
jgi:FixJ family two-component response regulator